MHSRAKKKLDESAPSKRNKDIMCFKCLSRRHIASQCPNKRVMVPREFQVKLENEDECKEKLAKKEDIRKEKEGEMLVVRHTLSA